MILRFRLKYWTYFLEYCTSFLCALVFLSVPEGERCCIRRLNEQEIQACFSFRSTSPAAFVFHSDSWLYCWGIATFFLFISPTACRSRSAFIILNVVGHGHVGSVRLAWFQGILGLLFGLLATLVCVLLAIMPEIWLTSRLLLFIMIHFARFYGCQGLSRDPHRRHLG